MSTKSEAIQEQIAVTAYRLATLVAAHVKDDAAMSSIANDVGALVIRLEEKGAREEAKIVAGWFLRGLDEAKYPEEGPLSVTDYHW